MIYSKDELKGTYYIELAKGKYKNKHHSIDSLYFFEENFALYELIFAKYNKSYHRFSYTNYQKKMTGQIIYELQKFRDIVKANKNAVEAFEEMGYDIYAWSNLVIDKLKSIATNKIISATNTLIEWLENTVENNEGFTILGL